MGYTLPSIGLQVGITGSAVVHDRIQEAIVSALKADADLMTLLLNDQMGVRYQHLTREQGDVFPYVVVFRTGWKEDKRFRDGRHGELTYSFFIYSNQPSWKPTTDVAHRIIKILDGRAGKVSLSNAGAIILSAMFLEGGGEMYDEGIALWFQERKLSLTVEFTES